MTQARFFTLKQDKPKRLRSYSDGDLAHYPEMKKSLDIISSGLWRCLDRKKEPNNDGFLYSFELRDELNIYLYPEDPVVWERLYAECAKVYPAVEPICDSLWIFIPDDVQSHSDYIRLIHHVSSELSASQSIKNYSFYENLMDVITISFNNPEEEKTFSSLRNKKFELAAYLFKIRNSAKIISKPYILENPSHSNHVKFLNSLGYNVCFNIKDDNPHETPLMTLPDLNFIQSRLSRLHPTLAYKKDLYCDNTGSDFEYLQVYLMGFQLQSHEKWFVHDHCAHLSRMFIFFYMLNLEEDEFIVKYQHEEISYFRKRVMECYQLINLAFIELDRKKDASFRTKEKSNLFPEEYTKEDLLILLTTLALQVDDFTANNGLINLNHHSFQAINLKEAWSDPENYPLWHKSCGQPFSDQALERLIKLYEKMLTHYHSFRHSKNNTDRVKYKSDAVTESRALTLARR